jgi:transcriptional regulator with XRE-family HTH domain
VSVDIRARFGNRLRQLRKSRGWSQAEMAHAFGLDRSYLAEIEEGKRNVSLINLKVIADGFKLSLGKLLSRL